MLAPSTALILDTILLLVLLNTRFSPSLSLSPSSSPSLSPSPSPNTLSLSLTINITIAPFALLSALVGFVAETLYFALLILYVVVWRRPIRAAFALMGWALRDLAPDAGDLVLSVEL
ncbi:hypothetical protein F4778DRAFT_727044 [Xylariomycetidae sp. FL2044]|nr:hypothetical protein F4778DRAFT_727044 [Xylariomycetidae sp. FL2044]